MKFGRFNSDNKAPEPDERPMVLVVEDDADIREFVAMEFMELYDVVEAEDGVKALAFIHEHLPDLVVTDLMMPNMDGIELCKHLKNDPETAHLPVVMLTAKSDVASQVDGLECGADDYVTKPFNIILLKARVANLLENRRLLCASYIKMALRRERTKVKDPNKEEELIDHLLDILEAHYADWNFNADEFATGAGMSLRTLQRKLKAVSNRSPAEFINDYRMKRASEILIANSGSITEVAFKVGFDESSSFSRMFKRYYGKSPSEYRQEHG